MKKQVLNKRFGELFKKYRLRSEIETLAEFGDLLAQEGIVYESSIFTRWQKGERVPSERQVILKIIEIFIKKGGIISLNESNHLLETLGLNYLTEKEIKSLPINFNAQKTNMQASLGGLIKDFRTQKGISQTEVSFALGWDNVSKLESIEQGKASNPTRKLIDHLIEAMKLEEDEKNELLLIGNYLPTEFEIEEIRKKTEIIATWPYSAILFDFSWRIVHFNKHAINLYGMDQKTEIFIKTYHPNILEIVFNEDFVQNRELDQKDKEKWREFLIFFVLRFRYAQRARVKEQWYISLIQKLMNNPLFRDIWMETQVTRPLSIYNFGTITPIINPTNKKKKLGLYFSMVKLLKDPRFELELDTPMDIDTFKYFESINY